MSVLLAPNHSATMTRPAPAEAAGESAALADRLDEVRHRHLNLKADGKKDVNRPRLSIWPAADEDMPPAVVMLCAEAEFGHPARYIDMSPTEARILARHLVDTANLVDRETGAQP